MMRRNLLSLAGVALLALAAGCGSDEPTAPQAAGYAATMSAAKERNADGTPASVTSTAAGSAFLSLSGSRLTYELRLTAQLTDSAVAAHIHVGDSTQAGPAVVTLAVARLRNGVIAAASTEISAAAGGVSTISADSLRTLLENGKAYVNVHSKRYPDGEIRGQVAKPVP